MEEEWLGKAVSIDCDEKLGVFQGIIKEISDSELVIVRAFRNGVPLRKQDAEVRLRSSDIIKINLLPSYNAPCTITSTVINQPTPVKQPIFMTGINASARSITPSSSGGTVTSVSTTALPQPQPVYLETAAGGHGDGKAEPNDGTSALSNTMSNMKFYANGNRRNYRMHYGYRNKNNTLYLNNGNWSYCKYNTFTYSTPPGRASSFQQSPPMQPQANNYNHSTASSMSHQIGATMSMAHTPNSHSFDQNSMATSSKLRSNVDTNWTEQTIGNSVAKRSPPVFSNSVAQFFGNLIPAKVEVRMGANLGGSGVSLSNTAVASGIIDSCGTSTTSKPIDIVKRQQSYIVGGGGASVGYSNSNGNVNGNSHGYSHSHSHNHGSSSHSNGYGKMRPGNGYSLGNGLGQSNGGIGIGVNSKKQQRKLRRENSFKQNQTFGTSSDDPQLQEDFDFEGNLALFDKQAIWDTIESEQNSDVPRQPVHMQQKKYRHDENIIASEPLQLRQIESMFDGTTDFVTDEGLVIPTIPMFVRSKIEQTAVKQGLSLQRQIDILARGASDLAILLLGGARRLTPNNSHQWPKVVIICEKSNNYRDSTVGAATGRQLASHGLKVLLYLEEDQSIETKCSEISLFKATGNKVAYAVNELPTPDLVIIATNTVNLSTNVKKWLSENRASVLAVDPPSSGIVDVPIKYAIFPILPLNGISSNNCGKLYLCNLGIPDKFYSDAGIKYKSPFGHKFVIPIHSKD